MRRLRLALSHGMVYRWAGLLQEVLTAKRLREARPAALKPYRFHSGLDARL